MKCFHFTGLLLASILLCISSSTEAFSTSLYKSKCSLECNTWDAVVSSNEIFIPSINIKTKGLENESYTLDITWTSSPYNVSENKVGEYYDKKGRKKYGLHQEIKIATFWVVKEMKKNGVSVTVPNEYKTLTDEVFKALTGIDNSDSTIKVNTKGAYETFYSSKERHNHYNGLGDLVSYEDVIQSIKAYPIYSRMHNIIIADEDIYYAGDYYPLLNEHLNNDKYFTHTYKYAKNSNGVWRRCEQKPYGSGWSDSWYDASQYATSKLDDLKSALGI